MESSNKHLNTKTKSMLQYYALLAVFKDELSVKVAAQRYGYTLKAFRALIRDIKKKA
jgi:hypothetical protein